MDADREDRLYQLQLALATLPSSEWPAFLDSACRDDISLRDEVLLRQRMLEIARRTPPVFEMTTGTTSSETSTRCGPGTRLGTYEIRSALGAGGMGEVYRARDTKLGRDVAIKILPHAFTDDPEYLARFNREARVLAALNHPNIAAIYGIEEAPLSLSVGLDPAPAGAAAQEPVTALVLELVKGETLAGRISSAHGPLRVQDALDIAQQIAAALEAAHEKGIVHRDLKPANIMITPDGVVKVLDFGLARTTSNAGTGRSSHVLTAIPDPTREGVILGTPAYMSPEHVLGLPADKRMDIWAFGCVVYEILTGRRAFARETISDTVAAIRDHEPDWSRLPPETPAAIGTLLRRCLEKDRRKRIADISTALFVLTEHASLEANRTGHYDGAQRSVGSAWRRVAKHAATAAVAAAAVGVAAWMTMRAADPARPVVSRLLMAPSGAAALTINAIDRALAITADGSRVIYVGNSGTQLFVRALDALEPIAVFTGAPRGPFVSPDGQWIGFVDKSLVLKRVAITGGPPVTLATLDSDGPRGATWGADDTIIFATHNVTTGLQRVAVAGGPTSVLTIPDRGQGEIDHLWPEILPGGRAVLFTITGQAGGPDTAQVAVLNLQTGMRTVLVRGGSHAHYVPSGHLVYAVSGTLRAVAFDLASLETRGPSVPVVPDVGATPYGAVDAVVANNGTLAYVSGGGAAGGGERTLAWVDRSGREIPIAAPPRAYAFVRLSPDGTRAALYAVDQESDIWLWDVLRTTLTRVTFEPGLDLHPVWTPDGRRLIFSSDRAGPRNLFWQPSDGTGGVERLTESPNVQNAVTVTPDGRQLIFTEVGATTSDDVMRLELDGSRRVTPLVQSTFGERNGVVSPDGRWLAYEANDSGRFEIYVRPFPEVNRGHWQVSTGGGSRPVWAPRGQELFYLSPSGAVMRVGVERAVAWAATTPTLAVKEGYFTVPAAYLGRTYDVAPDGQRFLMIKHSGGSNQAAAPTRLVVVQNWSEELRRLAPVK